MKLHQQVVSRLLYLYENYGGHKDEKKVRAFLEQIRLSPYQSDKFGICLVDSQSLIQEKIKRGADTSDVTPTKFHESAIKHLLYLFDIHGGYKNENRLRTAFSQIELTVYERKTIGDVVLVPTNEYKKILLESGIKTF